VSGGGRERVAYTVEHRGGCVLITGAVPVSALTILSMLVPDGSVMDPDVARIWGATFAFGMARDLDKLRQSGAESAERRERAANPGLSQAAARWLAGGHRGTSSNAIFSHLTGVDATGSWGFDTPHDPADFRRCRLLLEQVPELAPRLPEMKSVSPAWACLVDQWDTICDTMDAECPDWRQGKGPPARQTYELIKQAIGS
jgi:hypothetical protein